MPPLDTVLGYHDRTKHHLDRYARSLGFMDWSTQPDPFRRYPGAPLIELERPDDDGGPAYDTLFSTLPKARPLTRSEVSCLLYDSLAISAWKQAGRNRWALRVNPSSGNLHPTEAYVLAGPVPGLRDGAALYHYAPLVHGLELRAELDQVAWNDLSFPEDTLLVGLSSVHWRESWKYGERAFRYCQHDVGHALGALAVAAAMQGRRCRVLERWSDDDLSIMTGIGGQRGPEAEHPDSIVAIYPCTDRQEERSFSGVGRLAEEMRGARLLGEANELSAGHHPWPVVDEVAAASSKGRVAVVASPEPVVAPPVTPARPSPRARAIVRGRRSAVAMDGRSELDREVFFGMLGRLAVPSPFGVWPWPPELHLMLLVHRVRGLDPGLYALVRGEGQEGGLRAELDDAFVWRAPAGCPAALPLRLLVPGDLRAVARMVCCHQRIASDGAFAVAMLGRFRAVLEQRGPWYYRRLFWEAGLLGQLLYLEAEAAGLRATGIGCYFDDAMHEVLGLETDTYQSLYHFTVGGAVDDPRLRTLGAYEHLGG